MGLISACLAGSLLAMAACASSLEGGGIEKDPASGSTTTTGVGGSTTTVGTGTGTGGGGGDGAGSGPSSEPNWAVEYAWARLQGDFNSDDQEPTIEGAVVPPPRELRGCIVEAPDVSDRVVYVERIDPASEGPPDRQFLLSFQPGDDFDRATATVLRPVDATEWAGQCEVGSTLSLLGPVTADDGCVLRVTLDDASHEVFLRAEDPLEASCFAPGGAARRMQPAIDVGGMSVQWSDVIIDANGASSQDPVATAPADHDSRYVMSRRSAPSEPDL